MLKASLSFTLISAKIFLCYFRDAVQKQEQQVLESTTNFVETTESVSIMECKYLEYTGFYKVPPCPL